ncbi:uncharacterized protein [Anabrus simplex]|uniref:uncharacterized protein n=1 Tax=Anabrus simplex TaxID=316456 RepID=UPI0035A39232
MDLEVKIKEEPAWLEGTTTASLENIEHVSEVIALKEEVKSELTEPESTQENSLETSNDIKEEIFIEEHTDDQLLPYIKAETKLGATVCGTLWVTGGTCGDEGTAAERRHQSGGRIGENP